MTTRAVGWSYFGLLGLTGLCLFPFMIAIFETNAQLLESEVQGSSALQVVDRVISNLNIRQSDFVSAY